jgi:hypothetical protein
VTIPQATIYKGIVFVGKQTVTTNSEREIAELPILEDITPSNAVPYELFCFNTDRAASFSAALPFELLKLSSTLSI